MRLFVANLRYSVTAAELMEHFESYGDVVSARIGRDHETGQSRGFGFVRMRHHDEAVEAIRHLDGSELHGRRVAVAMAREREQHTA